MEVAYETSRNNNSFTSFKSMPPFDECIDVWNNHIHSGANLCPPFGEKQGLIQVHIAHRRGADQLEKATDFEIIQ